jgi:hypothetical protein
VADGERVGGLERGFQEEASGRVGYDSAFDDFKREYQRKLEKEVSEWRDLCE